MQTKSIAKACVLAMGLAAMSHPATAGDGVIQAKSFADEIGAPERISQSGKLRMLSQRIAASACHLSQEVAVEHASEMLTADLAEFDRILTALEFGDLELNIIGSESRRKTLAKIDAVKEKWAPIKSAAQELAQDHSAQDKLDALMTANMELLDRTGSLVTELVGQYSNPAEMVQADSMVIDIAGRQGMLSQKISKESCLLALGYHAEEIKADLSKTVEMFEASLEALRNGMSAAGVKPPPTEEIAAGLEVVHGDWTSVKPIVDEIAAGSQVSVETQAEMVEKLDTTVDNMNKVVEMYTQYATKG